MKAANEITERSNKFMKRYLPILFLAVICLLTAGCSTRTSDSGYTQKTVGKKNDSNIYVLNVTMLDDPTSNKSIEAEGVGKNYNGVYGYGNTRLWQDGKGLVSVHVNSISPSLSYVKAGMDIVLKTTDLKIMAIDSGYSFTVKCRNDYEPVASLQDNEMVTDSYDTYELDYCRMSDPEIIYSGTADAE